MSRSTLSTRRKALYGACAVLALLGLGEIAARLAGVPDPRFPRGRDVFTGAWLPAAETDLIMMGDPALFWRLRPGLHGRPWLKPLWIDTQTNSLGLRSPEITCPKPAGHFRVLCLGDSCTYGSGVRSSDSYPARLEQTLNMIYEDGVHEVVNAGVPGYSSFQGLRFLERWIDAIGPDVVTVSFWPNDSGTWLGTSDAAAYQRLNSPATILLSSALARVVAGPIFRIEREAVAQALERDGRARAENKTGPDAVGEPESGAPPRATPEDFADHLVEIFRLARSHGARPLLILHPLKGQIDGSWPHESPYQQAIREVAQREAVPLIDLLEVLKGRTDVFIDNCHLKEEGCLLLARALAGTLQSCGILGPPPTLEERRSRRIDRLESGG
ncbi:MAG: GDSL-type esterase/lipase family protein [Planctomycetota bacterium]